MIIQVKKLGALEQAEFELGDMTIICGGNNTGKTYATYALFGFLSFWREVFFIQIPEMVIHHLFADGVARIDITDYMKQSEQILANGCRAYAKQLPMVFAAPADRFEETEFQIILGVKDIRSNGRFERKMRAANADIFSITKDEGSTELIITFLVEKEKAKIPKDVIVRVIGDAIKEIIFGHLFPNPFIASAERTGAAIFRRELNFPRNRMMEEMSQTEKNINPMELLFKVYKDYALPVKTNVEFTRQLETISKRNSFIADKHLEVLTDFADIIGGEYTVTRHDELYYIPKGKRIKLSMDESSSAVRSLLDIGFYLRHVTRPGDLLMVDEPELNLHPENQRRIARLFARLVNLGIKVFITTHSDYIIKELNTLIMLNRNSKHLARVMKTEGYRKDELLSADKVRVYIAEEKLLCKNGNKKKTRCLTLVPADIDQNLGIEAKSFDTTIDTMNRIQEDIFFGEGDA